RPVDPGDRQERRGADRHRRSPLPDRARQGGVDRELSGVGGRARNPAPLPRRLIGFFGAPVRPGQNRNQMVTALVSNSTTTIGDLAWVSTRVSRTRPPPPRR